MFFKLNRHGRIILRSAQVAGHDKNFVLIHQLLRSQYRALGVIARVLHQQFEFAVVDGALLVKLVDPQLHTITRLFAVTRQGARQVLNGADNDFILADALLFCGKCRHSG